MKKLTIEEMHRLAKRRGGICLSNTYLNSQTKILWQCKEGHKWKATPDSIKRGTWCPTCWMKKLKEISKAKRLDIDEMQRIAKRRGGKCLSNKYVNNKTHLLWECSQRHKWKATPNNIKNGHWCPECDGKYVTILDIHNLAKSYGGKCLSTKYVNNKTHLLWECREGHRWKATPNNIKNGHWCRKCSTERNVAKQRLSIDEMHQIAKQRGGKCLSEQYVNIKTPLLWECKEGHQWKAAPGNIKIGQWCPHCAGKHVTLKDIRQIAKDRGGKCLSDNYVNTMSHLQWECFHGHTWKATPMNIKKGHWCPECSSGLGERICRVVFEQIFGKKFPRSYPKWLINQKGNRMELDGYCKSLGLAFEHHGEQHYSIGTQFISTNGELNLRMEADKLKRELCKVNDVILIEVPEIPRLLSLDEVNSFLKREFEKKGVNLPKDFSEKKISFKKAYKTSVSKEALKELHAIAKERGGKCLSDIYINSQTHLLWECSQGHKWKAKPNTIKNGVWCRKCSIDKFRERMKAKKLTIEEMQNIAKKRGGKCLSIKYVDSKTHLLWECSQGHQWLAVPNNVKSGTWCPKCRKRKKGRAQIRKI